MKSVFGRQTLQLHFVFSSSSFHLCVLLFAFKTHQWLHSLHNDKKGFLGLVGSSDDGSIFPEG